MILMSTPAIAAGISVSTLSVEISTIGSSTATASPSDLSQRVMVPSVTLSPNAGSTMMLSMPAAAGAETGAASSTATGAGGVTGGVAGGVTGGVAGGVTGGAAGAGVSTGAPTSDSSPIKANSAPTSTTSSSWAANESRIPVTGEGISVSTLSVEISTSGSSALTWSPTLFNQRVIVPSVTLSPSCGILTETDIGAPINSALAF